MKPRHITYIIWIIIHLLSCLCLINPSGGINIGRWTLRWPTMAEVLGTDTTNETTLSHQDMSWIVDVDDYDSYDNLGEETSISYELPKREVQPLRPKYYSLDSIPHDTIDSISAASIGNDSTLTIADTTASPTDTESASADSVIVTTTSTKPEVVQETKPNQVITPKTNSATGSDTSTTTNPYTKTSNPTTNIPSTEKGDTRRFLSAFYQSLDSSYHIPIRVVHYGDSQIEEDRITDILRERWQKKYGGGGVGLIPLHQTIPTRSIRQWTTINNIKQNTKGGPKRYLIYGPRSMRQNNNDYGIMGQVAVMDNSIVAGSQEITMFIEPTSKKDKPHKYFSQLRILTDNIYGRVTISNNSILPTPQNRNIFSLPDSTYKCNIHLKGKGKVYGVSLETPTGVIVDNIPMRGCSGTVFTRINSASLIDYFHSTNTRLIIMQYGGNMIPQTKDKSSINNYVTNLRKQVRHIRACAPYASILFIGPSDMSTRVDGKMVTYPMVPYLDQKLQKMAEEEGIAYWSMYNAMGGKNSMVTWVEKGLAGRDYVHFTRAGANKIGKMLGDWIDSYNK